MYIPLYHVYLQLFTHVARRNIYILYLAEYLKAQCNENENYLKICILDNLYIYIHIYTCIHIYI